MKRVILLFTAVIAVFFLTGLKGFSQPNAWINELHYDNAGTDTGEFIEVVIENAGTYTLSDFTVTLYNGSNGETYAAQTLDNFTSGSSSGNFTFYTWYPSSIQNGAPDGLCIDYQGTVIQFLSYEGTFTATDGPANGLTSTDIGVSETSSTPTGHSLQLSGTGTQYSDFTWQPPAAETPGTLNNGQAFGAAATPTHLAVTTINNGNSPLTGVPFEVVVQAQDDSNIPANVTTDVNVTLTLATGTGILGGTLTGTILTGNSSVTISGVTYDTGETGVSITATDDAAGLDPGTSDPFEVIAPIEVANIAAFRAGTLGELYKITGEVVLTFQQSFRHQKYIEDASAAILIDDNPGVITTTYNLYDGLTGIIGTLGEYGNMLQFVPVVDAGVPTSAGNTITPQVITLNELYTNFENYEAELVKVNSVSFDDAGGTFGNGQVYAISDASKAAGNFRATFYDVDYIGTTIPTTADLTGLPNSRTEGDYLTSRFLADIETSGLPEITSVYSTSTSSVDVNFSQDMTSVDPSDYYIFDGTVTIIFNTAVIDPITPSLVHFSDGSPAMGTDLTLDEFFDDAYGTSKQFYAGISPVAYTNTTNPGGTMLDNFYATFSGIVSANDSINNVWVSDAAGAYNGILIYDSYFDTLVAQGDEIIFAAQRSPYNNLSELENPVLISTISTGNTPYGPTEITGSDIESTIPFDTDPAESWEGQLVKITDFTVDSLSVVSPNYACSWSDAKATYTFYIGDGAGSFNLTIGSTYTSVTGVVDWYWSGPYYRINPRNQGDIEVSILPPTQLAIVSVNGGIDPYTNTDFEVLVQAQDVVGNPALVTSDLTFTFTTNGGDLGDVAFVSGTTTTGTILTGTSETTVTGVQMAPAGTNVTITATDDNPFGLPPGVSDPFNVVELVIPDIIITEVMQNPTTVSDTYGEWFEVFNNSASPVDMTGWIIKDLGTDNHTITGPLTVPAYGFAVLGRNADPLLNGGYTCDYQYSSFILGNSDDEIIIYLPDGIIEVDRIEWDGGPIWPDPAGASMVYTGVATEDNNVGEIWAEAVLVEDTYTNSEGDYGSPGTNGNDQVLTEGFSLDLNVLLEGFYNPETDSMNNYFRQNGLLPFLQPFIVGLPYYGNNAPVWEHFGTEISPYIPYYTTDWILIELRDAIYAKAGTGTKIPAFVNVDGQVCSYNGSSRISVKDLFFDGMYIVIYHLNHLSIMSSTGLNPVAGTVVSYDFTTGSDKVYGGSAGYKELETGVWGMVAGDINADGVIDQLDNTDGWATEAGEEGTYQGSNLYIDGQINNLDKNELWAPNINTASQVPL